MPGWFVRAINLVIKDLSNAFAYLNDVVVFHTALTEHLQTFRAFLRANLNAT